MCSAICFVCNLPIMSHQVGLVWSGGNGWDDLMREQVNITLLLTILFLSINLKIGIFLSFCALCSLSRILGMRVNNSTATWRTTRLSRTIRTVTSQHITATDKPKSKTKLARTTDRHSARMEWDEHETQSKATAESSRDIGRLSEKSTVAQNQQ